MMESAKATFFDEKWYSTKISHFKRNWDFFLQKYGTAQGARRRDDGECKRLYSATFLDAIFALPH